MYVSEKKNGQPTIRPDVGREEFVQCPEFLSSIIEMEIFLRNSPNISITVEHNNEFAMR